MRHAVQELEQGARALRELETVDQLVSEALHPPADHVAHVQLGHLVVAHVEHGIAAATQQLDDLPFLLLAPGELHADEDVRLSAGVAVIELGDRALAEGLDELPVAARPLGNGHCE